MKGLVEFVTALVALGGVIVTLAAAAIAYVPLGELAVLLIFAIGMAGTASLTIILSMLIRIAYREPPRAR